MSPAVTILKYMKGKKHYETVNKTINYFIYNKKKVYLRTIAVSGMCGNGGLQRRNTVRSCYFINTLPTAGHRSSLRIS